MVMENNDASEAGSTEDSRRCRRLKTMKQHADLVDEIERGLSRALQDYRYHAEEVLARHLVELENTEARHDLEVAKLRAENNRLRDALGTKAPETALFQTVLFQQMEETAKDLTQARRMSEFAKQTSTTSILTATRGNDEITGDDGVLNIRKMFGKRGLPQESAGAWQHFVAWVPNGAALRPPEPWKPLPPDAFTQPPTPKGEVPALPGMVCSKSEHTASPQHGKGVHKEGDSSDSDSNAEEKEPYEVHEAWRCSQRQLERLRRGASNQESHSRTSGSGSGCSNVDEDYSLPHAHHWFIVHPHSRKRVMWDVGSLMMVVYDMIMIPMTAFNLPDSAFLSVMDWATRLFWTFDMGWSVLTAVVLADGKIAFSLKFIVKRYLKTWFALDALIVSFDWMEVLISSTNVIGLGRLARAFRIARVVRLLRLVRMQGVMQAVTERVQSDKLAFLLSTSKLLVFVLVFSHIFACLWWAVGDQEVGANTWISISSLSTASVDLQYLVCLHWSLAQFTGGMDEIVPANTSERLYTVITWVFAFMATAVIYSILTSNLTHLHIIGGAQARQLAILRKYLKQNRISSNLALQVQRSAQHAVAGDLAADGVELLAAVAEPLRVEMNFEIFCSIVRNHPFFCDFIHEDPQVMRRICHCAMCMSLLAKGDVVFSKGEVPRNPKMYFVVKGLLEYYTHGEAVCVGERQWVAEGVLWTTWTHRGTFAATTDSKLALLDAQTFRDIVHRFKGKNSFDPRLYAADFVDHLNSVSKVDDQTFIS